MPPRRIIRGTSPGALLAALRYHQGVKQETLADAVPISPYYLRQIEHDERRPTREMLESILAALAPPYPRYQEIMEAFYYPPEIREPNADEIAAMRKVAAPALASCIYPAFLRDTATRILDWNRMFPLLSPQYKSIELIRNVPMVFMLWDPEYASPNFSQLVAHSEEYMLQQVRLLYHEWQQAVGMPWCQSMLARLFRNRAFERYWKIAEREAANPPTETSFGTRWQYPTRVRAGEQTYTFYVSADPIQQDRRFSIVALHPADVQTLRKYSEWLNNLP